MARARIFRALVFLCLSLTTALRAHDPGISTAQGQVHGGMLELTVGFAPADAQLLLPASARTDSRWTEIEFEKARGLLLELAPQLWEMRSGGQPITPREVHVQLAAGDSLNFRFVFPWPESGSVTLRGARLGDLPPGHRQFVIILDERGSTVAKKLISATDPLV